MSPQPPSTQAAASEHAPIEPRPVADNPRGDLPSQYRPADHEERVRARWEDSGAFHADPSRVLRGEAEPFCILIPPPNVTAALHLGHAFNNTLQDVLVRAHRMMGYETLWMPGTDHAGTTQAVGSGAPGGNAQARLRRDVAEEFIAGRRRG